MDTSAIPEASMRMSRIQFEQAKNIAVLNKVDDMVSNTMAVLFEGMDELLAQLSSGTIDGLGGNIDMYA